LLIYIKSKEGVGEPRFLRYNPDSGAVIRFAVTVLFKAQG